MKFNPPAFLTWSHFMCVRFGSGFRHVPITCIDSSSTSAQLYMWSRAKINRLHTSFVKHPWAEYVAQMAHQTALLCRGWLWMHNICLVFHHENNFVPTSIHKRWVGSGGGWCHFTVPLIHTSQADITLFPLWYIHPTYTVRVTLLQITLLDKNSRNVTKYQLM